MGSPGFTRVTDKGNEACNSYVGSWIEAYNPFSFIIMGHLIVVFIRQMNDSTYEVT